VLQKWGFKLQTIVLIEDEASIADMVLYALKSEGFSAEWFQLGNKGISWLKSHPEAGLVILDVGLPDGNGFEFCKEIRRFSEIPIVFLTARNDEVDRIVGLEIGGDDYVAKPFSPRELTARVKAILKRTGKPAVELQQRESTFIIDSSRRRICFYDNWLDLTHYEYEILKTLLKHPERIYSRSEIMDRVWAEPGESLDRAVDCHIKTLRTKLRQIRESKNPIKTHRGMGYSISGSVSET
jgi:two-component system, OmpR family, catabolic regulation response regulator CreB